MRGLLRVRRGFSSSSSSSTETAGVGTVIFCRHGQSTWNKENIFIGMTDTPLTPEGAMEARVAGRMLLKKKMNIDVVYTSLLRRSTKSGWLVMQELGLEWVPTHKTWLLNERNYGALVGKNKKMCVEQYGKDQVKKWRRSWDCPPPPMEKTSEYWPGKDPRYAALGINVEDLPLSESLKDVTKRTSVFWDSSIVPELKRGKVVMIVGHENNLRSIIKRIDDISDEDILHVELPRAVPLVYKFDMRTMKPIGERDLVGAAKGLTGRYLENDSELAKVAEREYKLVYDLSSGTTTTSTTTNN